MDITKIPKFVIWAGIAVFVLAVLYSIYLYYITSFLPPYQRYFTADCTFYNNKSVVILSAKVNINNITVYSFNNIYHCYLGNINQYSMNGCELNNTLVAGDAYVRIKYIINNNTYMTIIPCKIKDNNVLSKLI